MYAGALKDPSSFLCRISSTRCSTCMQRSEGCQTLQVRTLLRERTIEITHSKMPRLTCKEAAVGHAHDYADI